MEYYEGESDRSHLHMHAASSIEQLWYGSDPVWKDVV